MEYGHSDKLTCHQRISKFNYIGRVVIEKDFDNVCHQVKLGRFHRIFFCPKISTITDRRLDRWNLRNRLRSMFEVNLRNSTFLYPERLLCKACMHLGSTRMSSAFCNFSTIGAKAGCESLFNANCFTRPNWVKYSGAFTTNSSTNILPRCQLALVVKSSTSKLIISGHCFMYSMKSVDIKSIITIINI